MRLGHKPSLVVDVATLTGAAMVYWASVGGGLAMPGGNKLRELRLSGDYGGTILGRIR